MRSALRNAARPGRFFPSMMRRASSLLLLRGGSGTESRHSNGDEQHEKKAFNIEYAQFLDQLAKDSVQEAQSQVEQASKTKSRSQTQPGQRTEAEEVEEATQYINDFFLEKKGTSAPGT